MIREKLRVLVLNEPEPINGVTWWRMYRPLALLARQYPDLDISYNRGQILPTDLLNADVALAFRPCNPDQMRVLLAAKDMGCRVILDYDDDLVNIPVQHGAYPAFSHAGNYVKGACVSADDVWVSTSALGKVCHTRTGAFTLVPNAILEADLPAAPNRSKMGIWRGGVMGFYDLWDKEANYKALTAHCKKFTWVGYCPPYKSALSADFLAWDNNVANHFSRLKTLVPGILWKPLSDCLFNESKSNIAWIEATVAGGVCFTDGWRQRTRPEWSMCLPKLSMEEGLRRETWQRSADFIRENLTISKVNEVRYRSLLGLDNRA